MVEMDEREILASLRGYLEELKESGVDELPFGEMASSAAAAPAKAPAAPIEAPAVAAKAPAAPAEAPAAPAAPEAPTFSVDGVGNPRARLLFVRAGAALPPASEELLSKIIAAMGFAVPEIYIMNYTADPQGEKGALREAVLGKVSSVAPEVVVALGESAAQLLLKRMEPISALRGRFVNVGGIPVMATLHPDQLVADEGLKRQVWMEMKQVMARLSGSSK